MDCPNLGDVKFSQTSIDAINDIRRIKKASGKLINVIGAGHVINIFLGNGALKSSYNIYSTDFEAMSIAMAGVPSLTKRRIDDVSRLAYLSVKDYKEKRFWQAISDGCSIQ